MIFETHAHYDDESFNDDREALIRSLPEKGIGRIINVGASIETTKTTLELAAKYDYIYAAVGVHPEDIERLTPEDMQWLADLTHRDKVVAIGESVIYIQYRMITDSIAGENPGLHAVFIYKKPATTLHNLVAGIKE